MHNGLSMGNQEFVGKIKFWLTFQSYLQPPWCLQQAEEGLMTNNDKQRQQQQQQQQKKNDVRRTKFYNNDYARKS